MPPPTLHFNLILNYPVDFGSLEKLEASALWNLTDTLGILLYYLLYLFQLHKLHRPKKGLSGFTGLRVKSYRNSKTMNILRIRNCNCDHLFERPQKVPKKFILSVLNNRAVYIETFLYESFFEYGASSTMG